MLLRCPLSTDLQFADSRVEAEQQRIRLFAVTVSKVDMEVVESKASAELQNREWWQTEAKRPTRQR